jgi:NAD-dependent DNA ligase
MEAAGESGRWTRRQVKDLVERYGVEAILSASDETDTLVVGEDPGLALQEPQTGRIQGFLF